MAVALSSKALKRIIKELNNLTSTPPEDIQMINNDENLTEILAWIRGPDGTPYEEGYFKVRLVLDEGFPDTPPKGYFVTKIFHPNVSPVGEICLNILKKDWKPELGIEHVLLTIKCLLIEPNPESALNEEAGKLLLEQYADYAKRAKLYTSIQAKSGKTEYWNLSKQRAPHNEENKASPSSTTKDEKKTADVKSSSISADTSSNNKKRPLEGGEEQQPQDITNKKAKKMNSGNKKKSLRRL